MINPQLMCSKHLIGEHGELHKFLKSWEKKTKIYLRTITNAIEPESYLLRHNELTREIINRAKQENRPIKNSPIIQPDFSYLPIREQEVKVNRYLNLCLLYFRCPVCKKRVYEKDFLLAQKIEEVGKPVVLYNFLNEKRSFKKKIPFKIISNLEDEDIYYKGVFEEWERNKVVKIES